MKNTNESLQPVAKSKEETKEELDRGEVKEYLRLRIGQEYLTLLEQDIDKLPDTQIEDSLQVLKKIQYLTWFIKHRDRNRDKIPQRL